MDRETPFFDKTRVLRAELNQPICSTFKEKETIVELIQPNPAVKNTLARRVLTMLHVRLREQRKAVFF